MMIQVSCRGYATAQFMQPEPDMDDILRRGQLPVFIPNYYRGAYRQFPRTAGCSSHRESGIKIREVYLEGILIEDGILKDLKPDMEYNVLVKLPLLD